MLKKLSTVLSTKIYKLLKDDTYDIDVLSYVLECILNTLITTIFILMLGIISHHIILYIIWIKYFGGFHAPTHFLCITLSIITCTLTILLSINCNNTYKTTFITVIFVLPFILKYAPISSKQNILLNNTQKKFHKIFALVFFISGVIISVIFNFYKFTSLSSLIIYTIISVYLLAIIEIFLRKKQIKYQNNNTEVAK